MKVGIFFFILVVSDVCELVFSSDFIVFVVGVFVYGKVSVEYIEKMVFISNYFFFVVFICVKFIIVFEEVWGVI